ncbi:hypothetical protein AVEN_193074-1 [Araneus ventricosus]|uniref:Uncharacterized protein n=1 Tax=Araneus ventricosus TaxID=182803 RepID=A0A4Y2B0K0_ARAVE|nr:hypothetical protein AVEN_193074-1 [Araneus ventricosus]
MLTPLCLTAEGAIHPVLMGRAGKKPSRRGIESTVSSMRPSGILDPSYYRGSLLITVGYSHFTIPIHTTSKDHSCRRSEVLEDGSLRWHPVYKLRQDPQPDRRNEICFLNIYYLNSLASLNILA